MIAMNSTSNKDENKDSRVKSALHPKVSDADVEEKRICEFILPSELIYMIFDLILPDRRIVKDKVCHFLIDDKLSDAVCFALTCHHCWEVFKKVLRRPVHLYTESQYRHTAPTQRRRLPRKRQLIDCIQEWLGSGYRVPSQPSERRFSLLAINVYGAQAGGAMEKALMKRIRDYHRKLSWRTAVGNSADAPLVQVPNPFGMGLDWYPAVGRILKYKVLNIDPHATVSIHDATSSWLNMSNYGWYHLAWRNYKDCALRDWVEAQPEAREYRRVKLGMTGDMNDRSSRCDDMKHGFAMFRLVHLPLIEEDFVV